MHLRRALLLFAIVLALAALAATLSGTPRERSTDSAGDNRASARPTVVDADSPRAPVRFHAERPTTRRLETGRAATVSVAVDEPGLVEIPQLGLSAPADPLTPARFELLRREEGSYRIAFTPADGDEGHSPGTLVVGSPGAG